MCSQWLRCEGQSLDFASKRLQELPLREGSTVHVTAKLVGGGGDGGSTGAESRDAFLEMYKIPKADKVQCTSARPSVVERGMDSRSMRMKRS